MLDICEFVAFIRCIFQGEFCILHNFSVLEHLNSPPKLASFYYFIVPCVLKNVQKSAFVVPSNILHNL